MNKYPGYLLLFLGALLSVPFARAQNVSSIQPLGNDTYSVTATATNKFTRDTEKLKSAGITAATQFCTKEGKQFKLLSATENKTMYVVGPMASTTITFKAVPPGEADNAPASAGAGSGTSPATDAFAADMLKLDDLHKRGILTDDEYASAKKKVLDRLK